MQFATNLNKPTSVYTDFREYNSNWTECSIYLPAVGKIGFSAQDLQDDIHCSASLDTATGNIQYFLTHHTSFLESEVETVILTANGQMSAEIQIGQLSFNSSGLLSSMSSIIGGAATIAAGNVVTGTGALGAGIIQGITAVSQPSESVNGGYGNRAVLAVHNRIELSIKQYGTSAIPTSVGGRPLCQNRQIKTLSGYIKCGNASVPIKGFSGDKDAVNSYLNNGFYYE